MVFVFYIVFAMLMMVTVLLYSLYDEKQITVEGLGVSILMAVIWPIGIIAIAHILMTEHKNVVLFKLKTKK